MKLSKKKAADLYNAIWEPIMKERLFLEKNTLPAIAFDDRLFNLQNEIWRKVHKALNLDGPA